MLFGVGRVGWRVFVLLLCVLVMHCLVRWPSSSPYETAIDELAANEFMNIVSFCTKEIEDTQSAKLEEALLLRATFFHLQGEGNKAVEDLDRLLSLPDVDKRVCTHICVA